MRPVVASDGKLQPHRDAVPIVPRNGAGSRFTYKAIIPLVRFAIRVQGDPNAASGTTSSRSRGIQVAGSNEGIRKLRAEKWDVQGNQAQQHVSLARFGDANRACVLAFRRPVVGHSLYFTMFSICRISASALSQTTDIESVEILFQYFPVGLYRCFSVGRSYLSTIASSSWDT